VRERDGHQCTYTGPGDHRCTRRRGLHLHHIIPHALGGEDTVANLTVLCNMHNAYVATLDFGATHMARAIERSRAHRSRQRGTPKQVEEKQPPGV